MSLLLLALILTGSPFHLSAYVAGRVRVKCIITSSQPFCISCDTSLSLRVFPSVLAKWPPYEAGVRADGEGV